MGQKTQSPLWAWATKLPAWQSDLLRRLTQSDQLSEDDVDEVLANVREAVRGNGSKLVHGRRLKPTDLPHDASATGSPRLQALTDIVGVGALRNGARLELADKGITVVFGDNGAGKSTYARLLKQACRARVADDVILPNVFSGKAPCEQTYALETYDLRVPRRYDRKVGAPPEPALGSISEFDASCADHYVAKVGEPAYVPSAVQLVERLARAQALLRDRVAEARGQLIGSEPDFSTLPRQTRVAELMDHPELEGSAIRQLAHLTPDGQERLRHLEKLLTDANRTEQRRRELRDRLERMRRVGDCVRRLKLAEVQRFLDEWTARERQVLELEQMVEDMGRSLEGLRLRPVGTRTWLTLWNAAQQFFSECEEPTPWGETCPLCQQSLHGEAARRFVEFSRVASAEVEKEVAEARDASSTARHELERMKEEARQLTDESSGVHEWSASVQAYAQALGKFVDASLTGGERTIPTPWSDKLLNAAMDELQAELDELSALDHAEQRAGLEQERNELLACRRLAERLKEALRVAAIRAEAHELDKLHLSLSTNKVTRDQKSLTAKLVTKRLADELERARRDLRVAGLRVELAPKTRRGKPLIQLALPQAKNVKPEAVFSAGERRLLALAFFLAETAAADHDGTIVLDDPVSSVDADRRRWIAARLLTEAKRRQVIVFTHDPLFLIMLRHQRRGVPMTVLTCENLNGTAGYVEAEEPWATKPAAKQVRDLRKRWLKNARKHDREGNADAYRQAVETLLKRLRQAWERAVSELFRGVVEPGSFEVQTQKLREVEVSEEAVAAVDRAMTLLSPYFHDDGLHLSQTLPGLADLESMIEELEDFVGVAESIDGD